MQKNAEQNGFQKPVIYMNQEKTPLSKIQDERSKILSTFLIPDECWDLLGKYKAALGKQSTAELLDYLLKCFQGGRNTSLAIHDRLTTQYQGERLNLRKHNFLVDPLVWHRFKCLARFYGLSMCRLFTALLLALASLGTPKNQSFILLVNLFERVEIPCKTATRWYKVKILDTT